MPKTPAKRSKPQRQSRPERQRKSPGKPQKQSKPPERIRSGKHVYFFGNGKADGGRTMKKLLGGKGAGLAEMTNAGLPVPPGFTITTQACTAYYASGQQFPEGMMDEAVSALQKIEEVTGKGFGRKENPLLVSVRSGAKFTMP